MRQAESALETGIVYYSSGLFLRSSAPTQYHEHKSLHVNGKFKCHEIIIIDVFLVKPLGWARMVISR